MNGGLCMNEVQGTYVCKCPPGWSGKDCILECFSLVQNGIPFQNQYSMDSGRGSLPVEDVLETHPPIPESLDDDGADEPVPFIHLPSPRPESCLYDATDNSCIRASSSSLTNYRAICQATESDSSDEETSSVISEMQEELRPYIKAGSHNSADQINSLPDYVNYDVKSG